ncbi:hypothetical protein GCM10023091_16370 [Ravibacter arvi]|uniref:Uncharacterized protein n=1 Tax=Ravibacter arvi TaxID=2051041 RepID=A0ABP8LUJ3_9BACT
MNTPLDEQRELVVAKFFNQYLEPFFVRELRETPRTCHLAKSMLLFAALDFYGKIYRTGLEGFPKKKNGERDYNSFNNSEKNYIYFVKNFFPIEQSCKGIILYRVFRCGIMHQIVPKGAGVSFIESCNEMFINQSLSNGQNIPVLNLYVLEKIVVESIYLFRSFLLKDKSDDFVNQISNELIYKYDGFGDFEKLNGAIRSTPELNNSIVDKCNNNEDIF